MTAERLTRYRDEWCKDFWLHAQRERGLELFAHIDALSARVAELEARDKEWAAEARRCDKDVRAANRARQAAEAKLETLRKVFAPMFKQFGPEWPDGEGLEVVLSHPDDEDGEEGVGACHFTLGQLRRALQTKDTTP